MTLLERLQPLNQLKDAWQEAKSGNGRVALINGEAGIGKTSLVQHFVQEQSHRVFWGTCDNFFTPRPFGPIYDIANQIKGDLQKHLVSQTDRQTLFSALLSELENPTIIIFEDIHWADEATLDLLKYLGRRIQRTSTLLIATFRNDSLDQRHPLRLLLGDLVSQSTTQRLTLAPLSLHAVAQISNDPTRDVQAIHSRTGGNPFFVTELLASDDDGIPASVRDVILARVARLSLSGQAVLHAAAVIGQRIEPWLLMVVSRTEPGAIDECLNLGILLTKDNLFTFRHEITRQAILEAIPLHQQTHIHQVVLDALRTSPLAQEEVARLAHHAKNANDADAILHFGRKAGFEASQMGMHRAATTWFEIALPFSQALSVEEQMELYENYALHIQSMDLTKSIEAFQKTLELAEAHQDPIQKGLAWVRMAVVYFRLGEVKMCDDLLLSALALLEPLSPNRALVSAYPLAGMRQMAQGNSEAALAYAEKGHQMALKLDGIRDILQAYQVVGMCTMPFNHTKGLNHIETCLRMAIEHKQFRVAGSNYANLIMYTLDLFQTERAAALVSQAKAYLIEHDLDFSLAMTEAWEAMLHLYQGRWSSCKTISGAVLEKSQAPIARIPALIAQGRLAARLGEVKVAKERLDEALVLSKKVNNLQRIGVYYCAAAEAAWLIGDEAAVKSLFVEYYETAVKNKLIGFAAELAYWGWHIGEAVETYDWMHQPFVLEIGGDWQAAADAWQELGCPYEQARALAMGDLKAQKSALIQFEQLGADPMIQRLRQKLFAAGVQTIPRGPRPATRENPFNLTNRQVEILTLLTENLTNSEIAARLYISPKTVDHHVSAVLGKLQVSSRVEAAEIGRGILK